MPINHTPGPWHFGIRPGPMVYGPNGEQVANLVVPMLEERENLANARLIALTPDLVLALRECVTEESAHCLQHQETPGAMARRLRSINEIARRILSRIDE